MRITGANLFGPQNKLANVPVHQKMAQRPAALQQGGQAGLRAMRDTFSLSPYGKANSALSGLEKLKEQIQDRRDEYLSKATEEGQSADSIKAQLDSFDQQLKDIDKQIAQLTIQQTMQNAAKEKQHTTRTLYKQPKTRQEVENQRLADITNMSTGLQKAESMHSMKTQVDGDIGIKESEIELEKSRGGDTKEMEKDLAELQHRSTQLSAEINGQLNETLDEIEESNDRLTDTEIADNDKTEGKDDKDKEAADQVEQGKAEEHVSAPHHPEAAARDEAEEEHTTEE